MACFRAIKTVCSNFLLAQDATTLKSCEEPFGKNLYIKNTTVIV